MGRPIGGSRPASRCASDPSPAHAGVRPDDAGFPRSMSRRIASVQGMTGRHAWPPLHPALGDEPTSRHPVGHPARSQAGRRARPRLRSAVRATANRTARVTMRPAGTGCRVHGVRDSHFPTLFPHSVPPDSQGNLLRTGPGIGSPALSRIPRFPERAGLSIPRAVVRGQPEIASPLTP